MKTKDTEAGVELKSPEGRLPVQRALRQLPYEVEDNRTYVFTVITNQKYTAVYKTDISLHQSFTNKHFWIAKSGSFMWQMCFLALMHCPLLLNY